jgi:hypothetical protein
MTSNVNLDITPLNTQDWKGIRETPWEGGGSDGTTLLTGCM